MQHLTKEVTTFRYVVSHITSYIIIGIVQEQPNLKSDKRKKIEKTVNSQLIKNTSSR